ncbi:hypothetical protein HZA96_04735 [Candidatus Woesearchaeota archaeon]|nr:hypothetical protein [Candidatus Woesearchaeota archaeon]
MPHQCVRCNVLYSDGSNEILKGCSCGCKLFFYVKRDQIEKMRTATKDLSEQQRQEVEEQISDILDLTDTEPVILDFESVRIVEPGKFEIDLVNLFNKEKPVIYKLEDGKYMIDIAQTFKRNLEK